MNHEVYEKQMIDAVNRNAEEKKVKQSVVTKTDKRTFKRGLMRSLFALITAAVFALGVFCFIATAKAPGYIAVVLFIAGVMTSFCGIIFMYAQGITDVESTGDSNE